MAWRAIKLKRLLVGAICICLFIALYIGSAFLPKSYGSKDKDNNSDQEIPFGSKTTFSNPHNEKFEESSKSGHHLGVVIPFRDRFEELLTFAPFIHRFLNHKKISHDIIVVNQADTYRFNRAALINVGFTYATSNQAPRRCDYIAMHDVDLLPLNNELPYEYPEEGNVMHVAAPGLHPKYNYPTFIGGILLVSVPDYKKVDGMSNIYWGWGLEDDEFYVRLKHNSIKVNRPEGIKTGKSNTFRHIHSPKIRPRDQARCFDQYNKTKRRDRITGLSNVNYNFLSISHLTIDEAPLVVLNVKLHCNTQISPWCDCNQNKTSSNQPQKSSVSKSRNIPIKKRNAVSNGKAKRKLKD